MRDLTDLARFRKQHPEASVLVKSARWGVIDTAPTARPNARRTLVLLPGTLGTAEVFWLQMRALSRQIRLIAFTYPAVPDLGRFVDGVAHILRLKGVRRASVLGSSLGGYTAQLLAARYPHLVERLLIGNSLCNPHAVWRGAAPAVDDVEATPARDLKAQRVASVASWPESDSGLKLAKQVVTLQCGQLISARHLKARVLALARARDLPRLGIPDERIAIIDCADDPVIPPPGRAEVRERYGGAAMHSLPTGGHYPYISRAETYAEILREHLLV